ncbi:phosphatase 2C-like domain-containing protein [Tribonema minus]|uniref:protein-serine/threonine phosphatase n=1 Tax=Tribonema minus TaxID=303371 RepID=A0A835Z956_9STRA|nr:phosphatase 2C-like domain-containing protein [Tribonema minus]
MEDAHTIVTDVDGLPGHAFVAVYDGHVRATCAEYAGKEMLSILRTTAEFRQYCKQRGGSDGGSGGGDADASALLGGALRSAFIKMDEALRHLQKHGQPPPSSSGGADPGAAATLPRRLAAALLRALAAAPHDLAPRRKVGGCTALCALVTPRAVVLAHAGDARAIVCAGGGVVAATKTLTVTRRRCRCCCRCCRPPAAAAPQDHKPHDPAECARIVAAGGFVRSSRVDGNLAISRALGDFDFKDASLPPQDCKVFRLQAMSVLSNKGLPLGACCEELLDQCYHMGSMDNMTIVMVAFPGLKRGRCNMLALKLRMNRGRAADALLIAVWLVLALRAAAASGVRSAAAAGGPDCKYGVSNINFITVCNEFAAANFSAAC